MKPLLLLLFSMSASGSLAFLVYLLVVHFAGKSISASFQYIALKFCLALYLIPFPLIKHLLFRSFCPPAPLKWESLTFMDFANSVTQTDAGFFIRLSSLQKWLLFLWAVLLFSVAFFWLFRFLRLKRLVAHGLRPAAEHTALLSVLKEELHIRRPIQVYDCDASLSPFTYGIFRPVIVLTPLVPKGFSELALRHELQHIKAHDFFHRLLLLPALLLHCFNPLIYIFFREFMEVQEMQCDEHLIHSFSPETKKQYGHMLIDIAASAQAAQTAPVTAVAFSKTNSALVKKRIRRLAFTAHPQKTGLCLLLCLMLLCASVPVYAYSPATLDLRERLDEASLDGLLNSNCDWYSLELNPTGTRLDYMPEDEAAFAYCDKYLLFEDGTVLPLGASPVPSLCAKCSHSYVKATRKEHLKKGSGCTVNVYNVQVCTKCKNQKLGSLIETHTYAKCPH